MRNCNFRGGNAMAWLYNSASGTLFHLKLTEDIEQKLRKTMIEIMLALFDYDIITKIKRLFLAQLY